MPVPAGISSLATFVHAHHPIADRVRDPQRAIGVETTAVRGDDDLRDQAVEVVLGRRSAELRPDAAVDQ
jgi:hypothetical protein